MSTARRKEGANVPSHIYAGHTISLLDMPTSMRFEITGPLFGEDTHDRIHESFSMAQAAIDKAMRSKNTSDKVKLELPVYNEDGGDGVINGIHAGNGALTGSNLLKENQTSHRGQVVYPREPWIKQDLTRHDELRAELGEIDKRLREVEIDCKRSSWGRPEPGAIAGMLDRLQADYKEACKKAKRK